MARPTRFYSNRQEKKVAKNLGGRQVANSGATNFSKGDVVTELFMLECKTCTEPRKSISIQRDWLDKTKEEAFAMGKPYSALVFDFGDNNLHYIINETLFRKLNDFLLEEEKQ